MTDANLTHKSRSDGLAGLEVWLWIAGIASIIFGGLAIIFPFAATLATELLFGAILAASGLVELVRAFAMRRTGSLLWNAVFGILALVAGAILLLWPLEGILTLTIIVGVFFLLGGALKLIAGFTLRGLRGRGWIGFSGALSLLVGFILLLGLPATASWAIGILVGIDLIFFGLAEIAVASSPRRV